MMFLYTVILKYRGWFNGSTKLTSDQFTPRNHLLLGGTPFPCVPPSGLGGEQSGKRCEIEAFEQI